jgi:hypothetical protein
METMKWILSLSVVVVVSLALVRPASAEWGPPEIAVQGVLTNLADEPVKGPVGLTFAIYEGPEGEVPLWTEQHNGVDLANGRFDLLLGSINALDAPPIFEQFDSLWIGITVGGAPELSRAPLASVGYAMQARHAEYCNELTSAPDELVCEGCIGTEEVQDGSLLPVDLADAGCEPGEALVRNLLNTAWECGDAGGFTPGYALKLQAGELSVDKQVLNASYVEEDEENSISNEMIQPGAVTNNKIQNVSWFKVTDVPEGFSDGIDDGVTVEVDPIVSQMLPGGWCNSDGESIFCTNDLPLTFEDDPQVGINEVDYVAKWDGEALVKSSIKDGDTVEVDTDLEVHGKITINDNKIEELAAPEENTDAANKQYVDTMVANSISALPAATGEKMPYTVVLALRTDANCPAGYEVEDFDTLQGPNGNLHININKQGLFMGGMNALGHSNHVIYSRIQTGHGITKICWKTFTSSSRWPHASVMAFSGGNAASCPVGYDYIPRVQAAGTNNNHAYMMSNDAGLYIGYVDAWTHEAHTHMDDSGYMYRDWTTEVDTLCMRIMGVDEDEETKNGVFPVILGLNSESQCPEGWNLKPTSTTDGTNGHTYLQFNDNSTFIGGIGGWGHSGNNQMNVHFHYARVNYLCWNYFNRTSARPYYQIRTPHQGGCANDWISIEGSGLKGQDDNYGRIASTGHGLYMGGENGWGMHDYSNGYIQHSFQTEVNKLCLKLENVE